MQLKFWNLLNVSGSPTPPQTPQPVGPKDWDENGERKTVREELEKLKSTNDLQEAGASKEELEKVAWQIEAVEESLKDYIYMMPRAELKELKDLRERVRTGIAVRKEQEARQREIEAAEKRRAEQSALSGEVKDLLKKLPALPADAELSLLGADRPAAVRADITQAQSAADRLDLALDAEPATFQKLYLAAKAAVQTARSSIDGLPDAIAVEISRRQRQLDEQATAAEKTQQSLTGGWDKLSKPPPSVKKLKVALEAKDKALQGLAVLVRTGAPAEFDLASEQTRTALKALAQYVSVVNDILVAKKIESEKGQRVQQMTELRWQPIPIFTDEQFNLLGGTAPVTEMQKHRQTYKEAFAQLETLKEAEAGVFEEARTKTASAYEAVDKSYQAAAGAYEVERKRRTQERTTLVARANTILQIKGPKLISGTPEATEFDAAMRSCQAALESLRVAIDKAPGDFDKALKDGTDAVNTAFDVQAKSAQSTQLRLDEVQRLKLQHSTGAARERSALPKGPSPAIQSAVAQAFEQAVARSASRIDGKDSKADLAVVAEFEPWLLVVAKLTKSLNSMSTDFTLVAANKTIRDDIGVLLASLSTVGISETAVAAAGRIVNRVGRVAAQYSEIAELTTSYHDIIGHPYYLTQWKSELDPYLTFERTKDDHEIGELTKQITAFSSKFDEMDTRVRKRERADKKNAAYAASVEGQFIQYWDDNGTALAVLELTRLVNAGSASWSEIKRCYLSSHDSEAQNEFSVEVSVDIDGSRNVVVHAHCTANGTPKGGNACHFKLANNKRASGNTGMLNAALRAALLPSKDAILGAAPGKWEGYRPSYM